MAIERLHPECKLLADRLLDNVMMNTEAERRIIEGPPDAREAPPQDQAWKASPQEQALDDEDVADNTAVQAENRRMTKGERYKVTRNAARIRDIPSLSGKTLGVRLKGELVEVSEYDETGCWRRVALQPHEFDAGSSPKLDHGWMML